MTIILGSPLLRDSSLEHVGQMRRKRSSGPNMVLVQKMKRKVRSKLVQRCGIVEMNYAVCAEAVTSEQIVCVGENQLSGVRLLYYYDLARMIVKNHATTTDPQSRHLTPSSCRPLPRRLQPRPTKAICPIPLHRSSQRASASRVHHRAYQRTKQQMKKKTPVPASSIGRMHRK